MAEIDTRTCVGECLAEWKRVGRPGLLGACWWPPTRQAWMNGSAWSEWKRSCVYTEMDGGRPCKRRETNLKGRLGA